MEPLAAKALSSRARVELIGRVLKHDREGMPEVILKAPEHQELGSGSP